MGEYLKIHVQDILCAFIVDFVEDIFSQNKTRVIYVLLQAGKKYDTSWIQSNSKNNQGYYNIIKKLLKAQQKHYKLNLINTKNSLYLIR